jgi:MFS family permease
MALVVFIPAISQSALIPALPELGARLGTSLETTAWVLTAYFIVASVGTPISGRLGALYGKRRVLLVLLGCYAVGSAVCLVSDDAVGMIGGRALQGLVGGCFSLAFAILNECAPPARRRSALAVLSVTVALGTAAGFLVGGVAVERAGPEALFQGALGVSGLAAALVLAFVPADLPLGSRGVDIAGGLAVVAGTTLPLVAISQANRWGWLDERTLALVMAGVGLLAVWIAIERRVGEPMVELAAVASRPALLANIATLFQGAGMFGLFVLTPQLAQQDPASGAGLGMGATGAGMLLAPGAILMLLVGPASSRLGRRVGDHRVLALGSGLAGCGLALLAVGHGSVASVVAFSLVACAGLGCAFPAMPALVSVGIAPARVAEVVAFNAMMRGIGSAVGAQASAAVLGATALRPGAAPADEGYVWAFLLGALASGLGGAVAMTIRLERASRTEAAASHGS